MVSNLKFIVRGYINYINVWCTIAFQKLCFILKLPLSNMVITNVIFARKYKWIVTCHILNIFLSLFIFLKCQKHT